MSSRPKKGAAVKKPEAAKAKREKPIRPAGKLPEANVSSRHGTSFVTRPGRGFSLGEVTEAGMGPRLAARWGIHVDARRRSVIKGNVDSLTKWGGHQVRVKRAEGKIKAVEEEVEKVAREVKEEAVLVEKEAVKIEKEVKREAVGAGKAVEREAEKAEKAVKRRARPKKKAES